MNVLEINDRRVVKGVSWLASFLLQNKGKTPTEVGAFGIINDIHCKAVEELMFLLVSQLYITNI